MIEKKIRAFMTRRGIKFTPAARAINMAPSVFSAIMRGKRKIKADEFMALLSFLEVTAEELNNEPVEEERSAS